MKQLTDTESAAIRALAPAERLAALKGSRAERAVGFERAAVDEGARTVELAFASETPYTRWWGTEILDISAASMRLDRIRDAAPLLVGHDPSDHVGVVEEVKIGADRIARARVRFGRSARAEEVFRDVLDEIRTKVSMAYLIHDMVLERMDGEEPTYRVTDYEPFEISLVSVPADHTVGVGRAASQERKPEMTDPIKPQPADPAELKRAGDEARAAEQKRVADLLNFGAKYPGGEELARGLISDPTATVDTLREKILDKMDAERKVFPTHDIKGQPYGELQTGLRYNPASIKPWERHGQAAEQMAYRAGQWARAAIFNDANAARWCKDHGLALRVMTEGVGAAGGFLVPDEMESAVIDLRAQYGVARRICRMVPMGSAAVSVPKRSSGTTAYFAGENTATTESDMAWGQVELVAKELSALTRISMSLAEDAVIDIAAWLADEQAYAFAVKEDNCLIIGDGTSTYGGMKGINTLFEDGSHTAGQFTAATNTDAAVEVIASELSGLMAKLPSYARTGARWLASPAFDASIFGRLMAAGGGNTIQTLQGQVLETLYLGYPRTLAEPMPASSTTDYTGKVMALFGNFSQGVLFGERRGITVQVLRERYAEFRQIGVMGTERIDIVAHGCGDTTSAGPIVALIGG